MCQHVCILYLCSCQIEVTQKLLLRAELHYDIDLRIIVYTHF